MRINIKATGMELTGPIRDYVNDKIGQVRRLLPKGGVAIVDVEVERTTAHHHKGEIYRTEVNISLDGWKGRAESTNSDLYAAIDEVKDELSRGIIDVKTRKESLFRKGARIAKRLLRRG